MPRRPATKPARGSLTLLLVDDHPMWRDTLRNILTHAKVGTVVGEASDGVEAVAVAKRTTPDVVVMDVNLPEMDGIEATRRLVAARPDVKVLVLASSDERAQVIEAVRAGASGYVLKTAEPDEVVDAVRRVALGEPVFPPTLANMVLDELRRDGTTAPQPASASEKSRALDSLTPRERDVLALMAEGHTNQAIMDKLFLGAKTVEAHVRSIFSKLGLEPAGDVNRRVRAVIEYLRST